MQDKYINIFWPSNCEELAVQFFKCLRLMVDNAL